MSTASVVLEEPNGIALEPLPTLRPAQGIVVDNDASCAPPNFHTSGASRISLPYGQITGASGDILPQDAHFASWLSSPHPTILADTESNDVSMLSEAEEARNQAAVPLAPMDKGRRAW